MILPIVVERIFLIVGGLALLGMISFIPLLRIFPELAIWFGASSKRICAVFLPLFIVITTCLTLSVLSNDNRKLEIQKQEKEKLQEQCTDYHNKHPDNWVICPVCEEEFK